MLAHPLTQLRVRLGFASPTLLNPLPQWGRGQGEGENLPEPLRTARLLRLSAVATVVAMIASGCSLLGGGGGTYQLVAYFPRAVSLYQSSNVRVLGLPSGTVDKIEVLGDRVKVTMSMASSLISRMKWAFS